MLVADAISEIRRNQHVWQGRPILKEPCPPAKLQKLEVLRHALALPLPLEYDEFLALSNGLGFEHGSLFDAESLVDQNCGFR